MLHTATWVGIPERREVRPGPGPETFFFGIRIYNAARSTYTYVHRHARRLDSYDTTTLVPFRRFDGQAEDDIPLQFISRPMPKVEVDMIANDTKPIKLPTESLLHRMTSDVRVTSLRVPW